MISVGIDPSLTATGIVALDIKGKIIRKEVIGSKEKGVCRLSDIRYGVRKFLTMVSDLRYDRELNIALEGYAYGRVNQMAALGELGGALKLLFHDLQSVRGWPMYLTIVPPATLKKFVTGKGNCKKDLMLLKTYKKWGVEFSDHNLCDAYGLARYLLEADKK